MNVGTVVWLGDSVLLVQQFVEDSEPVWTLPGGGVDAGENALEAAARETREETGIFTASTPQ